MVLIFDIIYRIKESIRSFQNCYTNQILIFGGCQGERICVTLELIFGWVQFLNLIDTRQLDLPN